MEPTLIELAAAATREEFTDLCPYPVLVATSGTELVQLAKPLVGTLPELSRVVVDESLDEDFPTVVATYRDTLLPPDAPEPEDAAMLDRDLVVLAVKKTSKVLPRMITVGRTRSTNDVVIDDARVSKLHAYFEPRPQGAALFDAGSRNGTWVQGVRLIPKGPPEIVKTGSVVVFAGLMFSYLDPGSAWDRIRGRST